MSLKRATELLDLSGVFFLATNSANGVQVRPFGVYIVYQNEIYFITNTSKAVFEQLKANQRVQISANLADRWFRITGDLVEGSGESLAAFKQEFPKYGQQDDAVTFVLKNGELIEYPSNGPAIQSII
ncbi:MAG: pyridoxamine 5'-phosphate oxidase family protein [Streptococcaceae bacterium]|nr:pyridoxamine 5'-phosphate oxidase family protein [Streptococcaceae bacterium]MCH4176707.1 pyridoxamine 5'-phosphate oxidase family protein [Streptococcaceae bacterium]